MKFVIASDIHGDKISAEKVVSIFKTEGASKLFLLGDIYNHGPRNGLPKDYSPLEVAEVFNGVKEDLIVVKGNCDSAVDTMISDFDFIEHAVLSIEDKTIFLTHGHVYNKDNQPKTKYDAVIYGHFHTGFIEKIGDTIFANTGSTTFPKQSTPKSYILVDDKSLYLKTLDGETISKIDL